MELTDNEKHTYYIIGKVVNGTLTRKEAMFELNKSRQQIYRLIKVFHEEGEKGFIHKGRGKKASNKKDRSVIEKLEQLYLDEYYDFNFEAFYDELNEKEKYKGKYDISYSTLYREFLNDDIVSPIAHKGTIKLYNRLLAKLNNLVNS